MSSSKDLSVEEQEALARLDMLASISLSNEVHPELVEVVQEPLDELVQEDPISVQCDVCGRWRILHGVISSEPFNNDAEWHCGSAPYNGSCFDVPDHPSVYGLLWKPPTQTARQLALQLKKQTSLSSQKTKKPTSKKPTSSTTSKKPTSSTTSKKPTSTLPSTISKKPTSTLPSTTSKKPTSSTTSKKPTSSAPTTTLSASTSGHATAGKYVYERQPKQPVREPVKKNVVSAAVRCQLLKHVDLTEKKVLQGFEELKKQVDKDAKDAKLNFLKLRKEIMKQLL